MFSVMFQSTPNLVLTPIWAFIWWLICLSESTCFSLPTISQLVLHLFDLCSCWLHPNLTQKKKSPLVWLSKACACQNLAIVQSRDRVRGFLYVFHKIDKDVIFKAQGPISTWLECTQHAQHAAAGATSPNCMQPAPSRRGRSPTNNMQIAEGEKQAVSTDAQHELMSTFWIPSSCFASL